MSTGYPDNTLATALDYKPGMRVFLADVPADVRERIGLDRIGLELLAAPSTGIDAAHLFVTQRDRLACELHALRQLIAPGGFIWVCSPDADSSIITDLTLDAVREVAQSNGLTAGKTCAIGAGWSCIKLMIDKTQR